MQKVRYGVIGIKGIGRYHCRTARENDKLELVALCDCDEKFVRERATELGVLPFTDVCDMLAANAVDAVSIAVPHHLLAPITLACLNAGVHCFVEKPFAVRLSDADRMIAAAITRNLKLGVDFQYRTYATAQLLKRTIESGELGTVRRVLWTWNSFRPQAQYQQHPWQAIWKQVGGGVLTFHAAHDIDLICWLFGRPVEVCAMMANQLHDSEVEDIAGAIIRFENGAQVMLQSTINQGKAYNIRQISGDKGLLVLPDVQSLSEDVIDDVLLGIYPQPLTNMAQHLPGSNDQPPLAWRKLQQRPGAIEARLQRKLKGAAYRLKLMQRPSLNSSGLRAMIDNFAGAILYDRELLVSGESARATVELINAMTLSALRGRTISLPLDAAEYDELWEELATGATRVLRSR